MLVLLKADFQVPWSSLQSSFTSVWWLLSIYQTNFLLLNYFVLVTYSIFSNFHTFILNFHKPLSFLILYAHTLSAYSVWWLWEFAQIVWFYYVVIFQMMNFLYQVLVRVVRSSFIFRPLLHWSYWLVFEHEYHGHIAYFAVVHWTPCPYELISIEVSLFPISSLLYLLGVFFSNHHEFKILFSVSFIDHHGSFFTIAVSRFRNNASELIEPIKISFCYLRFLTEFFP